MRDMANIIELVLNADRRADIDVSHILTEHNLRDASLLKNLIWLLSDPEYEAGKDPHLDAIVKETPLDAKVLQGIQMACIMFLATDRHSIVQHPLTSFLLKLHDAAQALQLEAFNDACE